MEGWKGRAGEVEEGGKGWKGRRVEKGGKGGEQTL